MAQIQKGDTFQDGELVTGSRLNQLVDSAIILPEFISAKSTPTGGLVLDDKFVLAYVEGDAL